MDRAYTGLRQQELDQQAQEARAYLVAMQGEFREMGIETEVRILYGRAVKAILKAAEREGADLIAIASHGRSGLSRVFYGSVAAGLLERADRPLLLIPSRDGRG